MAAMLSHIIFGEIDFIIPNSLRRLVSHIISVVNVAIALHSASEDPVTVIFVFLDNHEIKLHPKKIMYADVEVLPSTLFS